MSMTLCLRSFLLCILLSLTSAMLTCAAEPAPRDYRDFGGIPVAHQGRIKPLESMARAELFQFSGDTDWHGAAPIEWLGAVLFDPETMIDAPFIRVTDPGVLKTLRLPKRADHFYSPAELEVTFALILPQMVELVEKAQRGETLPAPQAALLAENERLQRYFQLADSLALFAPLAETLPERMATRYPALPKQNPAWVDVAAHAQELRTEATQLAKRHGRDFEHYPEADQAFITFMFQLDQREFYGRQNGALAVVPQTLTQEAHGAEWFSLWQLQFNGRNSPQLQPYSKGWQALAAHWQDADDTAWTEQSAALREMAFELAATPSLKTRLWLEQTYQQIHPFRIAIGAYGLALILSLLWLSRRSPVTIPAIAVTGATLLALATHGLAMLARMLILGRPPVSNLYESVLFVALLLALLGCLTGCKAKRHWLIPLSLAASAALLTLSGQLVTKGEELVVVGAVLNTNFWLATHVVCITAGYAFCLLTSLLAHLYLWQRGHAQSFSTQRDYRLHLLALAALLLTATGTILGGIWADQSWGRFWGWDPKENGALLIVFWLVWLLHGYVAGQIRERWYLIGMAYLSVIVALAWFGVNLLSVGLHSYGFTDAAAWGLAVFVTLETLVISLLGWQNKRQDPSPKGSSTAS